MDINLPRTKDEVINDMVKEIEGLRCQLILQIQKMSKMEHNILALENRIEAEDKFQEMTNHLCESMQVELKELKNKNAKLLKIIEDDKNWEPMKFCKE